MSTQPQQDFISADVTRQASPVRLVLAVVACTFAVELLIMELIPGWDRGLSPLESAVADAAMLCVAMVPVVFIAFYQPMRATIRRLESTLGRLKLAAEVVEKSAEGILIADASARILNVNRSFSIITGYAAEEAIGKTTSLLKSGLHDADFYADMWEALIVDGEWQGEVWNRKKSGEIYLESLSITRIHPGPRADVHFVAIFTQANHDRLTGLANRHLFMTRLQASLEESARSHEPMAVLFIDLDGFKAVNDTQRHEQGDRLLQGIGRRLKHVMKTGQLAARFGGDEFAVLLAGPQSAAEAASVAESIRAAIREVASGNAGWTNISASIGVAVADGSEQADPLSLIRAADDAMYAAKRQGKDRIVVGVVASAPPGVHAATDPAG